MNDTKKYKSKSITARISDDELESLNALSEYTNKTVSDTILRAFKFWMNVADISSIEEVDEEKWGKIRKNNRIHARMTESDLDLLNNCSRKTGLSVGQILRRSIREYQNSLKGHY